MKAVVLHEVDGPLTLEDVPEPDGAVLDVRAAGVNFADVLIRRGLYPQMPPLPHVLGTEVAGVLDGRRVLAYARSAGGYAERVAVDPDWMFELPARASFAAGASFLTTFLTAHFALRSVEPGATVLVHAGSGGVGSAAIQLAKRAGATVVATASTEEKRAFARDQGADDVRAYDAIDDLRVDLVVDPVGGEIFDRSLPLLNPLGAIAAVGFAGGQWNDPSVQWLVGRNASVAGIYLGRLLRLAPQTVFVAAESLLALWEDGAIDPAVGATFPLGDAADAHELMESRRHVGKVVLEP